MDAAAFNGLFDEVVANELAPLGFVPNGRRLVAEDEVSQVAVIRTELRSGPPVRFTFVLRHRFLRIRDETIPTALPRSASDFPIKVAPSLLADVVAGRWAYAPVLNAPPADVIEYRTMAPADVRRALERLAAVVGAAYPGVLAVWTPARLRAELAARGSDAWWIERLWLDDYDGYLDRARR